VRRGRPPAALEVAAQRLQAGQERLERAGHRAAAPPDDADAADERRLQRERDELPRRHLGAHREP